MGKVKTRKTAEQRQAEMNELHEQIATKVEELRDTEQWKTFLRWAAAFRSYSFSNVLLIWSQMPEATHVAGFQAWKKLGRQVTKGQRGIRILGGRQFTTTEEDEETGEENTRRACASSRARSSTSRRPSRWRATRSPRTSPPR